MNFFEFLKSKMNATEANYSKSSRHAYAKEFFGSDTLSATSGEFLFYRAMQIIIQVATAGLLSYGFYNFFREPFDMTFGENGRYYATGLSGLLVIGYELLKFFTVRRAMFLLIKGLKQDYKFVFKSLSYIFFGLLLAYGSWKGANSGAEHMAINATDKSGIINEQASSQKEAVKGDYAANKKQITESYDKEIAQLRKELNDYKASVAWKGHIDTRNKAVVQTINAKNAAIESAKADKKAELEKLETEHKEGVGEIEKKVGEDLAVNSTKQSFYQKTVFWASIALEVFVFVFLYLIMSWIHEDSKMDQKTYNTEEIKVPVRKEAAKVIDLPVQKEEPKVESPVQKIETTPPPPPPSGGASMGNGKATSNNEKDVAEHRRGLNHRATLKSRFKAYYQEGKDIDPLCEQWAMNENRIEKACVSLGIPFSYLEIPDIDDFN